MKKNPTSVKKNLILALMAFAEISQAQMARNLGVTPSSISYILNGHIDESDIKLRLYSILKPFVKELILELLKLLKISDPVQFLFKKINPVNSHSTGGAKKLPPSQEDNNAY